MIVYFYMTASEMAKKSHEVRKATLGEDGYRKQMKKASDAGVEARKKKRAQKYPQVSLDQAHGM